MRKSSDRKYMQPRQAQPHTAGDGSGSTHNANGMRGFSLSKSPASGTDSEAESTSRPKPPRRRANPIWAACSNCRKMKLKCSGERPTCASCCRRDLPCEWDVREGFTRHAEMKEKMLASAQRQIKLEEELAQAKEHLATLRILWISFGMVPINKLRGYWPSSALESKRIILCTK